MSLNVYQVVNLESTIGSDLSIPLQFYTGSYPSTIPVDITGWLLTLTLKRFTSDASPVLTTTVSGHLDPTNGYTVITIPNATTLTLSGIYHYNIKWIDGGGIVQLFLLGNISFRD